MSLGDDLIGPANFGLLTGVSWIFASIALLSSLLLAIPVFASVSASEFLVRLFHLHGRQPLHPDSNLRLRLRLQSHIRHGEIGNPLHQVYVETKREKTVKIVASLAVWLLWFISLMVIFFRALDEFLLVGTAW
jgi:hypothetical protein